MARGLERRLARLEAQTRRAARESGVAPDLAALSDEELDARIAEAEAKIADLKAKIAEQAEALAHELGVPPERIIAMSVEELEALSGAHEAGGKRRGATSEGWRRA